ncbi:DUF354 domain-containing protein [Chloroflexota bacterium]
MKILVSVGHPGHVHFYKNFIWELEKRGHRVKIAARDKDIALALLENYGFDYELISTRGYGFAGLVIEMLIRHYKFCTLMRRYRPAIAIATFDPSVAQIGKILGISSLIFTDERPTMLMKWPPVDLLVSPFAKTILTLTSVLHDFGSKGVKMNGYKELAYLHPNYFKPNPDVLDSVGVSHGDKFVILRFVEWKVSHGHYAHGLSLDAKRRLVQELEKHARIFITSEEPLSEEFEKYRITCPPERIHDLLYYATLLVGDAQTMTTEAAVLGTPAIRCNSFVGPDDMGNFIELEGNYDLIYSFLEPDRAIKKALELVQQPDLKERWAKKREKLLADKIDITRFMVDFIENYPESFYEYREGSKG